MISIFYISRVNLLSKKTHVHNMVKTCEFLAKAKDIKITLVNCYSNFKKGKVKSNFLKEHNIKHEFPIIALDSLGIYFKRGQIKIINWIEVILANLSLIGFLFRKKKQIDVIYFRDPLLFLAVLFGKYFLGKLVFYEVHAAKRRKHIQALMNLMIRISNGVIAISLALKKYYEKLNKNIINVFCLAPEKENFPYYRDKNELRKELDLPTEKFIMSYVGRLDLGWNRSSYDIDKIIKALKFLPKNILFIIIGAKDNEIKLLKDLAKKAQVNKQIKIYPRISRLKVPVYLLASDILVIPKLGDLPGDSPAKMFEYLAAKKPIIAAKTKMINEILKHSKNALLVSDNTTKGWIKTIKELIDNKQLRYELSQRAFEDSKKYTWENRGKLILDFIHKNKESKQ